MTRKLRRFIERRYGSGPYDYKNPEPGRWMFRNRFGKIYGIRDYGKHLVLFEIDQNGKAEAICKLTKGTKIKEIRDASTPKADSSKQPKSQSPQSPTAQSSKTPQSDSILKSTKSKSIAQKRGTNDKKES